MKKTTKKSASKASHKKATKNLDVKPAKGGTIRGGEREKWIEIQSYSFSHQNRVKS